MAERLKGPWVTRLVEKLQDTIKDKNIEIERLRHENEMTKLTCGRLQDKYVDATKKIERLRRELEEIKDDFEMGYYGRAFDHLQQALKEK